MLRASHYSLHVAIARDALSEALDLEHRDH